MKRKDYMVRGEHDEGKVSNSRVIGGRLTRSETCRRGEGGEVRLKDVGSGLRRGDVCRPLQSSVKAGKGDEIVTMGGKKKV